MTIRRQASNIKNRCHLVHLLQESCPDISRNLVRIIAELTSEYYKMLVPNRQESSNIVLPVKPSHIYCGKDMSVENYSKLVSISKKLGCDCSRISIGDNSAEDFVVL